MGVPNLWPCISLLVLSIETSASARRIAQEDEYYNKLPPPPSPTAPAVFKPGTTVIVAAISAVFTITFMLLLYVQRCKTAAGSRATLPLARVDSGVNRKVIQQLPLFRFASLRGQKDGLECAVCLTRFEAEEVLRLLPKCKHAFHVECVDTWLDRHSTCPLCRYRVRPEDVLLIDCHGNGRQKALHNYRPSVDRVSAAAGSSRHSSAGERSARTSGGTGMRRRSSFDAWSSRRRSSGRLSVNLSRRDERPGAHGDKDTHRLEHKIMVSDGGEAAEEGRWRRRSEVQAAAAEEEVLYLGTEMLMVGGDGEEEEESRSDVGERKGREKEEEGIVKRLKDWIPQFQQQHKTPAKAAPAKSAPASTSSSGSL
ncbi:RING-H2 finger protein ATL43-like [Salvia miltiorrhiza]|uniref:RING-H2 finger protein ATL43-like n=1 Tax=Salvia miltiorrhiza TaxID=226208 RepID=UPI0025AC4502|nr:RING-H2 finger protein ATL43-like [Salvia miltiorrhiza]